MKLCKCGNPRRSDGQQYCKGCHAAYQRSWRGNYSDLSDEQRRKGISRSYLGVYVRRGKIEKPETCSRCGGSENIEGHHHKGYDKPLEVEWLCRPCHTEAHRIP